MPRTALRGLTLLFFACATASAGNIRYPTIQAVRRTFDVPQVTKADVSMVIKSARNVPLYKLECHSAGYAGDPDFDYSGDFECRLTTLRVKTAYSTLLTEDANQSRDWESRGRFFGIDLEPPCSQIPEFGATRNFELRGMELTLRIIAPRFSTAGNLEALELQVTVHNDIDARRPIAAPISMPKANVPRDCKLQEYFMNVEK